jgi:iron complex outermembrane receptor protein
VATGAFEVGDAALPVEKSLALDLTLRKKTGRVTGALSLFYTRFTDYIGLFATGRFDEGAEEPLPVYDYAATSAQFFGGELEVVIHLLELDSGKDAKSAPAPSRPHPRLDLELKADYVNATDLAHDRPLPRIPPFRASAALAWSYDRLGARIETQFAARQNRTADFELPTEAYYLLNASLTYRLSTGPVAWDVFLKGTNLTNQEARLSTSFLKDIAPLGGRGIALGLKAEF